MTRNARPHTVRQWLSNRTTSTHLLNQFRSTDYSLSVHRREFTPVEQETEAEDTYRAIIDERRFSTEEATAIDRAEKQSDTTIRRRTLFEGTDGELFLYDRRLVSWADHSRLADIAQKTLLIGTLVNIFPVVSGFLVLFIIAGTPSIAAGVAGSIYFATGLFCAVDQSKAGIKRQRIERLNDRERLYEVITENNMLGALDNVVQDPEFIAETKAGTIYRFNDRDMLIRDGDDVTLLTSRQAEEYLKQYQKFDLFDRFFEGVPSA